MSLIHWWPLNGDTQDRITNTKLINNGAAVASNGKTGQCYTFNGSTNLTIPYPSLNTLGSNPAQFSYAFWIKINSTWTGWGQVFTIGRNGASWTDIRIGFDVASDQTGYFTISDGSTTTSYGGPKHILTVGKWHHIAATFDNKEMKLFVDGQPASTPRATASVLPSLSSDTVIAIGGNNSEKGECDMCDVRIYDHALSQMEAKELSKALVVHYTFNDVLTEPTTNVSTVNGWSAYGSYWTITERTETGLKLYRHTGSTSDCVAIQNSTVTSKMAQGDIWTFSCYLYKNGQPWKSTASGISSEGYGYRTVSWESHDDGYYRITFQVISSPGAWVLHNYFFSPINIGMNCEMRYMQFEKKDHATLYTPTSRESMIQNEAGYANPSSVTSFQLSTITNSGSYSGYFDGQTSCIDTPIIKANMFTEDYTLSFWVYPLDNGRAVYFGDHQISSVSTINFERTADGLFRYYHNGSPDKSFANTDTPQKIWTMLTITYTPGTMKVYKNGVLAETLSHTATITKNINGIMRVGRDKRTGSDSGATPFYGYMSDFRFYVTCLNASDVQDLYSTKAYITNYGDIISYEFNSRNTEAQITSKYEIKCTGIVENSADYNMLDYVNFSSSAPGIDTGVAPGRNLIFDTTVSNIGGSNPYIVTQGNYGLRVGGSQFVNFVYGKRFRSSKDISQKHSIQGSDSYLVVSGSLATQESDNDSPSGNVILFKNQGNIVTSGYLYKCTLMNQDAIVRDFIPVQRKSDNAVGLLDLIENKFYTCSGISAGPLKASNEASIYNDGHISGREIIEI